MADNPLAPKDDGQIGLPAIAPGMNKTPPKPSKEEDEDRKPLGREDKAKEDDADILERIRKRFQRCIDAEADNRKAALEDRKFFKGDQWPADVLAQRNTDRRPAETVNKLPVFVRQVTNDQRENRPAINVSPVGDKSDKEAAKLFRGLIRAIERDCAADIAYDTAFENEVISGIGYTRMNLEWEAPDSFQQRIVMKRIRNPFSVYRDPDHQEPDGADMRFAFITEMIPRDDFKTLHPDAQPVPFQQAGLGDKLKNWSDKDGVRVAEYYEFDIERRDLVELSNGHVGYEDDLNDIAKQQIKRQRITVVRRRKTDCPCVKWYKVTTLEILERKDWLGHSIPIYPFVGNELDIEGKINLWGLIRHAVGAQRAYNYSVTAELERWALAPKAPFIVEEGQIEGHEDAWRQANTKSYPYLQYKAVSLGGTMAPPPQRQQPVQIDAAIVNARQSASQDMVATTGIRFDVTMDSRMVEESGRAIRELRRSGDLGSFHYIDNFARTLRRIGNDYIDLIPKVYDEARVITILREDDAEEQVRLDPHANQPYAEVREGQKTMKVFNPKTGRYGVTVTIGPSYATKRIEAAESMMGFAKALPNVAALIADLIAKNQDWPGAEEMATRLAKAVPPQLLTPEQKDMTPQVQAMVQNLERQAKELQGQLQAAMKELQDKQADRQVALEKIARDFEAKIIGTIQKAEQAGKQNAVELAKEVLKFEHTVALNEQGAEHAAAASEQGHAHAQEMQDQEPKKDA